MKNVLKLMLRFLRNLLLFSLFINCVLYAEDWPQFRGPERNGVSKETNLLKTWPAAGPALIWSYEGIGEGYSSPSIANGFIFVTGVVDSQETLYAFILDGKLKWKTQYGPAWTGTFPSARTTPTVDGKNIYVCSGMGNVVCLDAASGKIKWAVQAVEKFNAEYPKWGMAESPLIIDDKVICTPGGKNASVVALNKQNGKTVWQSNGLSELASYCSPILVQKERQKIIATMLEESFVGIDANNGKVLWQDEFSTYQKKPKAINPVSPIQYQDLIFTTSGYNDGSAMYRLSQGALVAQKTWIDTILDTHIGGVVLVDGYIYGSNWENNRNGNWVSLEWQTGKVMYEKKWINKGSIIAADGMLYCYEEKKGNLALVKATPQDFKIISSFKVPMGSGQHWAHPAISNGKLYLRHGEALMDIKAK
jgi:outer membrane protein assembly factor BamB